MISIQKLGEVSLIAHETYDRKNERKTVIFLINMAKKKAYQVKTRMKSSEKN